MSPVGEVATAGTELALPVDVEPALPSLNRMRTIRQLAEQNRSVRSRHLEALHDVFGPERSPALFCPREDTSRETPCSGGWRRAMGLSSAGLAERNREGLGLAKHVEDLVAQHDSQCCRHSGECSKARLLRRDSRTSRGHSRVERNACARTDASQLLVTEVCT